MYLVEQAYKQMPQVNDDARKHDRFTNNAGTLAEIDLQVNKNLFSRNLWALVIDESLAGCRVAVITEQPLKLNQICYIKISGLSPFKSQIVWLNNLSNNMYQLGLNYVD